MNKICFKKYKEVFEEYGVGIYNNVKLLKPLKFDCEYQIGIENKDLPVGEYIWIGGERRGHIYAFEESSELKGLRNISFETIFLDNFNYEEIRAMQENNEFAILTNI